VQAERARPWLGTITTIRASGDSEGAVVAAIDQAYAAIAHVHHRMSFQSAASDLAAIARLRPGEEAVIDHATAACLGRALAFAEASGGAFDPVLPENGASWRDLRLQGVRIAVRRTLRLDLSGIAKGYAVDRACERLAAADLVAAMVNAGGDLRTFGPEETVTLTPSGPAAPVAVLLQDGALASSDVIGSLAEYGVVQHRDGRAAPSSAAAPFPTPAFVSVAAPCCTDADALTKIVLAMGDDAAALLRAHDAVAYVHQPDRGWRTIGCEM
jgi:thiamine biosynthesis lipoprotein